MNQIIGLGVSKKWLDICVYMLNNKPIYHCFLNEQSGHEEFINLIKEQKVKLIVACMCKLFEVCHKLIQQKRLFVVNQ
ncbi:MULTISPECIES: hypothetical protein [unclassified Candidatus Tisiphia]|uniref:hypothetical protein n=1 Tax=unclassified Candidatus Tisiphia TaxID=2996318 RepID=UPI0035C8FDDA